MTLWESNGDDRNVGEGLWTLIIAVPDRARSEMIDLRGTSVLQRETLIFGQSCLLKSSSFPPLL